MIAPSGGVFVIAAILAGVLGLAIGSFLNVVVWRIPNKMSLSSPPSSCPKCSHAIRARDNIPVLSWLLLKGRCRDCHEPISIRYPLVELGTALAFIGVVYWATFQAAGLWLVPAYLYLAAVSIALALIDLDTKTLPNRIVVPSIVVMTVLLAVASFGTGDWSALLWAVVAGAALFVFYLLLVVIYPSGMGFGDVKLAAVLGIALGYLGWGTVIVGAFAAFLLGGVFSIVLLAIGMATRKTGIPFGPWMLLGAWVGITYGREISTGYLTLVGIS